jgi:Ca2+/Na+ antiporter
MKKKYNQFFSILFLIVLSLILRFVCTLFLDEGYSTFIRLLSVILIITVGAGVIIQRTANVIEETTDVLKDRTKIAGGLLQSLGTAFPDMVIGIVAAIVSLQLRDTDYLRAVNFAIVAASTTFGSNIYNILYSMWCIFRQNQANVWHKTIPFIPILHAGGKVKPLSEHIKKPSGIELDTSINILIALTLLTACVAVSMVLFGHVSDTKGFSGDLYQLIRPVGIVVFILCISVMYYFRKVKRDESIVQEIVNEERYYSHLSSLRIWLDLLLAGVAILFAAESMVKAIESFCLITHVPFVIAGILAGLIGCLGEITVVHEFVVNPKGRLGDAVIGVAMDNIVTTLGASIVAIMGGIFLGSNALILIFVVILTVNTLLIGEISKLKNHLFTSP